MLEQFVALGYIEAPGEDRKKAVEVAVREQKYNLSRVYLFSRWPRTAAPLLEELTASYPDQERFARHLAQCYVLLGRHDDAERVLTPLLPQSGPANAVADWLRGELFFERGQTEAALQALLRAEELDPQLPDLHIRIGRTYLRQAKVSDAERALSKALRIDPDSAEGHLWMARVRLRQRRDVEAAEEALNAVGRGYCTRGILSRRGTEPGWAFQACGAGLRDHPGDGARFRSRASLAGRNPFPAPRR